MVPVDDDNSEFSRGLGSDVTWRQTGSTSFVGKRMRTVLVSGVVADMSPVDSRNLTPRLLAWGTEVQQSAFMQQLSGAAPSGFVQTPLAQASGTPVMDIRSVPLSARAFGPALEV